MGYKGGKWHTAEHQTSSRPPLLPPLRGPEETDGGGGLSYSAPSSGLRQERASFIAACQFLPRRGYSIGPILENEFGSASAPSRRAMANARQGRSEIGSRLTLKQPHSD